MTLEGEYYKLYTVKILKIIKVAILMTLEGEYYPKTRGICSKGRTVAILMTLEGEYYITRFAGCLDRRSGRNPHDIGRRILLSCGA